MTRRVLAPLVALLLIAASAAPAHAAKRGCDPLGGKRCMLPWPSNWFTRHDSGTPTGLRLALPVNGMPANTSGKHIDPTDWNRADGFSPGQQITVFIKQLQTKEALSDNELPPVTDLDRVNFNDQRLLVIDARTGKRQLVWAELDMSAPAGQRALLIRPAKNLREGRRYVVALRGLRNAAGKRIRPSQAFKAIRDKVKTKDKRIEARRRSMKPVFKALKRAKVKRRSLTLAWDFTVASRQSTTGPMLQIRDAAFAQLGDTDLGDLVPAGHSPAFTVTKNQEMPPEEPEIARVVEGTVTVPCYLESVACAAGAGFHRGPDGLPDQIAGNTYAAFFRCIIPRDLPAGGGRALIYGHGLLGDPLDSGDFAQSQLRTLAAQKKFTVCGTYWIGLSAANHDEDTTQAAMAISDLSKFGAITDRLQQGMLNYLFLGRAMVAADGLRSHPAFAGAFDTTQRLFYDGNSQGGIEGGSLTAIAPDFDRAVLGVPGMNYSTLLQRSVDFAPFRSLLDASYTDPVDRALIYSLLSNLWDRGEANGYAAAHDQPAAAQHAAARRPADRGAGRSPGRAGHRGGRGAHDRGARLGPPRRGPLAGRRPVLRDTAPDHVPVHGLRPDRVRLGPGHGDEPAGDAAGAGGQRAAVRGPGSARVPAPDAGVA